MGVNDIILVISASICLIFKISSGLIRRYIVLYFFLPTKSEIRAFVVCQNGANIHLSVPTSLH